MESGHQADNKAAVQDGSSGSPRPHLDLDPLKRRLAAEGRRACLYVRLLRLPLTFITLSLVGSAYVLGMFQSPELPYYQFIIHKTCSDELPNRLHLHTEVFRAGTKPSLSLRLSDFEFQRICTAVEITVASPLRDQVAVYVIGCR